ncbi:MAG: metallophosphoesterase family protein [Ardenticatenales bacterium]|nr:metallophosphoesterase family protein [Ardenticatenales bacterium]
MDVVVLSDIHANIEALDAVMAHAGPFDEVWFLGDAVGYGPDPEACVQRLIDVAPTVWLAGNHDHAALGKLDVSDFNPEAREAAEWTTAQLSDAVRARLNACLPRLDDAARDITFVHASPRSPIREYILNAALAEAAFDSFSGPLCLFGHTHVPAAYDEAIDGAVRHPLIAETPLSLVGGRWLLNPGSVGQPRDGDARASYLRLTNTDADGWSATLQRVPYDIEATQAKILAAGLPPRLAARLEFGW